MPVVAGHGLLLPLDLYVPRQSPKRVNATPNTIAQPFAVDAYTKFSIQLNRLCTTTVIGNTHSVGSFTTAITPATLTVPVLLSAAR